MIHYKKTNRNTDPISYAAEEYQIYIHWKRVIKKDIFFRNIDHNLYCAVSEYQIWIN
jgi:hypothetical protein